jgi:hypothetical protein
MIANTIKALIDESAYFIATTSGMSVDRDDVTRWVSKAPAAPY